MAYIPAGGSLTSRTTQYALAAQPRGVLTLTNRSATDMVFDDHTEQVRVLPFSQVWV
jgi:hypothetical protein